MTNIPQEYSLSFVVFIEWYQLYSGAWGGVVVKAQRY